MKNYYEILGVNRKTSQDEIKNAYRNLAKKYHPDNNNGNKEAEIIFKDLNEAYGVLSDLEEKRKYDRKTLKYRYGIDSNAFSEMTYEVKKPKSAINDFMSNFLGIIKDNKKDSYNSLNTGEVDVPVKGENEETEINITLEEAFFGGDKKIVIKAYDKEGGNKNLTVNIPKGIKDGHKIRLAGCGKPGKNGGKNGDLIITAKISKNKEFEQNGIDLIKNIYITPSQAALGCTLTTNTIDGEVEVNIPACSQTDRKIKIPNKGFRYTGSQRGNLVVVLKIDMPKTLTDKQRELYTKLRECEINN